jgi:hypothetical protein
MSMTLTQIKEFADGLVQLELDEAKVRNWINEVLEENVLDIDKFVNLAYTGSVAQTWYALPAACVAVKEVYDSDGLTPYNNYNTDTGYIRFGDNGDYAVRYYSMADPVTTGTSTPDCHALLHKALCYYVAYRAENEDEANDSDGQYFLQEYQVKWANANSLLHRKGRRFIRLA